MAYNGFPKRAVDENYNSDYNAKSCTHTNNENNPWWRVDLGREHIITGQFRNALVVDYTNPVCRDEFQPRFISHGASQPGARELALAPSQDLARKLWRAVLLLARLIIDGKKLSSVNQDSCWPGWPVLAWLYIIEKLTFDVFNRHTGISATEPGWISGYQRIQCHVSETDPPA